MGIFESLENLQVSESCYHELITLVEEYINELRDKTIRNASDKYMSISQAQEENLPNVKKPEDLEFVKDDIAKRKHRANVLKDKYEKRVMAKIKKEESEKKAKKN